MTVPDHMGQQDWQRFLDGMVVDLELLADAYRETQWGVSVLAAALARLMEDQLT